LKLVHKRSPNLENFIQSYGDTSSPQKFVAAKLRLIRTMIVHVVTAGTTFEIVWLPILVV
jgi:hypothetical protein